MLDALISTLIALIALLMITGGLHHSTPAMKLELSQIDAFAWALAALMALRWHLAGECLPARLLTAVAIILDVFERQTRALLISACALYVALQTWNSAWRFDSFHASAFDLGFVDQALWSTAHGQFLHSTLSKGQTYLGEHFAPALGLVGLSYHLTDSVTAVFLLQSLVLAAGAPLVYSLARQKGVPRSYAVLAALCLLIYQPLRLANQFDFREDNLFVPVLLGALLALEKERWTVFWLLTLVSWTVKESAPLFTCLTGAWLVAASFWPRGQERRSWRLHGIALAALSAGAFLVINAKITPMFVGTGAEARTMLQKRLGRFGSTNAEIFSFLARHPLDFALEAARPMLELKAVKYVLNVALPFLPFVAAAPLTAVVAAAGLALNLLVNQPTIGFHYECILIPFLFYILVSGLARWQREGKLAGPTAAALVTVLFLLFYGRSPVESIRRFTPTERDRMVAAELAKLPPAASIATQSVLHPHLDHRSEAYLFSSAAPATDYIAIDLATERDRYATPNLEADARDIDPARYELIVDREQLRIWKRK